MIAGLNQHEFQMTVIPTDTVALITREVITITATSTDGQVIAQEVTEIHIQKEPVPTALSLSKSEVTAMSNWFWPCYPARAGKWADGKLATGGGSRQMRLN